jgi:hypothetical protein
MRLGTFTELPMKLATTLDSFKAAAKPTIKPINEKSPTTNPLLKPLNTAIITNTNAIISKNIGAPYYFASNSFTAAEIALPSARPASFLVAAPITLPISAGEEAPVSAIICCSSAFSSSPLNWAGKNFSITLISYCSF